MVQEGDGFSWLGGFVYAFPYVSWLLGWSSQVRGRAPAIKHHEQL